MKNSFYVLLVILILATLACTFTTPVTPAEPTVIFVPVTVTPQPTQAQPLPSSTSAPLPTIAEPPTATTLPITATSDILHFYVSGYVWHDSCAPYPVIPNPIPAGCLFDPINGLTADGIYQAGEPGIAGVTVRIEIDCNYGAFTTTTDNGGYYSMSFTVPASAGVGKQKICLSIEATSAQNASALLPGGWTVPKTNSARAVIQVTIPVEQQNTVNFGWDYQFQ